MGFPIISALVISSCPEHILGRLSPSTNSSIMDCRQILYQNQFINPWLPLSGQGFITDIDHVWAEPALTVESAPLHEKRDHLPRPYQDFEQYNHNPFSAYGTSTGLYR